jgi:hypothetical protein
VPVFAEPSAQLDTPPSAYLRLGSPCGTGPADCLAPADPLETLRRLLADLKLVAVPGLPRFLDVPASAAFAS